MVHGKRQTQDEAEELLADVAIRLRTARDLLSEPNNPVALSHLTTLAENATLARHILDNVIRDLG